MLTRRGGGARSTRAGPRDPDRSSPGRPMRRGPRRASTRPRKRSDAARSASSGSTFSLRARLTAANSTSPTSWKRASRSSPAASSSSSSPRTASYGTWSKSKPGGRRAALHLARVERPGQVLRHLAEDARLAPGLGALDRVPVAQHLAGVLDLDVAEDVRVPADQLLAAVLGDLGQRAAAALLEQQREEVDLEEDVAELVEQLGVVARRAPPPRARRPPRPCAGRSSARPARGPTGTRRRRRRVSSSRAAIAAATSSGVLTRRPLGPTGRRASSASGVAPSAGPRRGSASASASARSCSPASRSPRGSPSSPSTSCGSP